MVTFKERAEELAVNAKRVKGNNVYETLAKEFGISKRLAGNRFKSLFGMPVRDFISKNIEPSKEEFIDMIIKADNFESLYKLSGVNDMKKVTKLLNKYFNQSNFFKVRANLIAKVPIKDYIVTREDNESILISQILGDGSIERNAGLKIEHGYKQYDYLKFKIGLLNKAYPKTNGLESIRKRTVFDKRTNKTYYSFTYRTGEVLKSQLTKIQNRTLKENIFNMTPLGVCLYFMDDGYFHISKKYNVCELAFSAINEEKKEILIEYFKTYGYHFNNYNNCIALNKKISIIKFINDFIKPFSYMLPKCMEYKYDYKDIVG